MRPECNSGRTVATIAADKYGGDIDDAEDLVEQYAPMEILIGLPLHLNGKESASSDMYDSGQINWPNVSLMLEFGWLMSA